MTTTIKALALLISLHTNAVGFQPETDQEVIVTSKQTFSMSETNGQNLTASFSPRGVSVSLDIGDNLENTTGPLKRENRQEFFPSSQGKNNGPYLLATKNWTLTITPIPYKMSVPH